MKSFTQTYRAPKLKDGINRLRRFFLKLNLASPALAGHHACQIFRKNLSVITENLGILVVSGISSADRNSHNKLSLVAPINLRSNFIPDLKVAVL